MCRILYSIPIDRTRDVSLARFLFLGCRQKAQRGRLRAKRPLPEQHVAMRTKTQRGRLPSKRPLPGQHVAMRTKAQMGRLRYHSNIDLNTHEI